jgi:hypothetical protein
MNKLILLIVILLMSTSAFSKECASSISELKLLMGNSDLSVKWAEKSKEPLDLTLSNNGSILGMKIKKQGALWADVTGIICRKGQNYVAKVTTLNWGDAAPGIAKNANIKEISIKLPYQSMLKVSIMLFSFEFHAL